MNSKDNYLDEIKEIRQMMEQSTKFLSLSGLSGILVGLYALIGAFLTYRILYIPSSITYRQSYASNVLEQLAVIASIILVLSFITVIALTYYKSKRSTTKLWRKGTRLMLVNLAIPLVVGGILILIMVSRGIYEIASPSFLIFYGLALVNAAKFTRREIFYMGLFQVILGLFAALFPGYALFFWALGFGVIHIIYGTVMHFRYDHKSKN